MHWVSLYRSPTKRCRTPGAFASTMTLKAIDALHCGSRSMANTLRPCSTKAPARFRVVVVFPTPPLLFAMVYIRVAFGGAISVTVALFLAAMYDILVKESYPAPS